MRIGGSPYSLTEYGKPATDANTIFCFDIVKKVVGAVALPESPTGYNLPTVQTGYQGTPGTTLWQGASINYGALSTQTVHMVADEPDCIFMAMCDATNPMTTASYIGKNANINIAYNTGSLLTKQSGMTVNTTGIATTATLDLRLFRVSQILPNAEGTNAIVEVIINKHEFGQQTAGV
jgi:hypothetical protein